MKMIYRTYLPKVVFLFLLPIFSICSCRKLISINAPVTSINEANVYNSDGTAISVLTGIYLNMSTNSSNFTGAQSISLYSGLSADEFTLSGYVSNTDTKYYYYTNSLFSTIRASAGSDFWSPIYNNIFNCNAAIIGLTNATGLTPAVKQQLLGESKFMRAFFYFYLTNLFGDIPMALTTDYTVNAKLSKTPQAQIYQQIINDLKDAQDLLSRNYLDASLLVTTAERVRPTSWAATALLARTYLYAQEYDSAEMEATLVINNSSLYTLDGLNGVFLKNSTEAIWQLQPISSQQNTAEALLYIIPSTGPSTSYPVSISQSLLNSFEAGDQRKVIGNWIDSVNVGGFTYYYPFKYKAGVDPNVTSLGDLSEYLMMLRLGEQYLIRAEARAHQKNIISAQSDLDTIRSRAGLPATIASTTSDLLMAIQHERQVELFSELGHRWMDLKRTATVDAVMTAACPHKGSVWYSYQQLYPILFQDILEDPYLKQNLLY